MKFAAPILFFFCAATLGSQAAVADPHHAHPLLHQFQAKEAELVEGGAIRWDVLAWAGSESQSLRLRSRGEREHGHTVGSELEASWQRAVDTWWDVSLGWRGTGRPEPRRDWLAVGLHGMAPWFVEIDTSLYLAESGYGELRLEAMYELPLTQRVILAAKLELQANTRRDEDRLSGAGLHEIELGLRLRYEFSRKFAPYAGVSNERLFGDSRELARNAGQTTHGTRYLLGLTMWF